MKALQVALANLRDATKPLDAADRVILIDHITWLGFFAPDRNAIVEDAVCEESSMEAIAESYERYARYSKECADRIRLLKLPPKPERAK